MRRDPVTMRDWLSSVPDEELTSVVTVVPALRRSMGERPAGGLDDLRARIQEFTDQQTEGLARAFLAGVAQRLRADGVADREIDEPDVEQLRSMLGQLPPVHGRLALHALLIGTGPAASTARAHAHELLTALREPSKELPITTPTQDRQEQDRAEQPSTEHGGPEHDDPGRETTAGWDAVADVVERLRYDTTRLPPALRAAADAVAAGELPAGAEATAEALVRFATGMAGLAELLGSLLGAGPVPSDLDGVQVHLDRVAEEQRLAAERALVQEHRDAVLATIAGLEVGGGPAFLVESYRSVLAGIDDDLGRPAPEVPAASTPTSVVALPQTAPEARALLTGIGIDDSLIAVLRPWPELCEPGDFVPRHDVTAVVATDAAAVPELLRRLAALGVLRENGSGELALDDVTLRCLALLSAEPDLSTIG